MRAAEIYYVRFSAFATEKSEVLAHDPERFCTSGFQLPRHIYRLPKGSHEPAGGSLRPCMNKIAKFLLAHNHPPLIFLVFFHHGFKRRKIDRVSQGNIL